MSAIFFHVDTDEPNKLIAKIGNEQVKVGGGELEYVEWAEVGNDETPYHKQTHTIIFNTPVSLEQYRTKFCDSVQGMYDKPQGMMALITQPWHRANSKSD